MSLLRKWFVLGIGVGASRLIGAAITVILARVLGVSRFGVFSFAMSLALMLEVAIDMGQSTHLGRLVSRDPETGSPLFGHVLANKTAFGLVTAFGAWAMLRATGTSQEEALTVAFMVLWAGFLSTLDSERAVARALGMIYADTTVNALESVGRLACIVGGVALGVGLVGFGAAFALECGVAAVVFYAVLSRRTRLLPERRSVAQSRDFLLQAIPLGLAGVAFIGFYQVDQVFVRALAGPVATGLYGAATRVMFAANSAGGLVAVAAYPDLARTYLDRRAYRSKLTSTLSLAALAGLVISVVLLVFAEPIIHTLYGAQYAASVPLLRILAPIAFLDGLVLCGVYSGNALGRERRVLIVVGVMLLANVAANWLLVPSFGAVAAAWISTLGEAALAVALLVLSWDRLFLSAEEPAAEQREEAAC